MTEYRAVDKQRESSPAPSSNESMSLVKDLKLFAESTTAHGVNQIFCGNKWIRLILKVQNILQNLRTSYPLNTNRIEKVGIQNPELIIFIYYPNIYQVNLLADMDSMCPLHHVHDNYQHSYIYQQTHR